MNLPTLILLALSGSIVSLAGGVLLLSNRKLAISVARYSSSFAAGALIAAVFFDLLPEALELGSNSSSVLLWTVIGIVGFFVLERRLGWFHHHHEHEEVSASRRLPTMLVIGDSLHNAIDGAAIAFAYMADPSLGVVTTLAVALHEIPQEIGDFGLLLNSGWTRKKVILANLLSALSTLVTAVAVYFIGREVEGIVAPALALTAGTLLYIALSDIVPSVHEHKSTRKLLDSATLLLIAGVCLVWGVVRIASNLEHDSEQTSVLIHSEALVD